MSIVPKENIEVIAQSIGINNLSSDVALALAPDVEYRLREIMQVLLNYFLFFSNCSFLLLFSLNFVSFAIFVFLYFLWFWFLILTENIYANV